MTRISTQRARAICKRVTQGTVKYKALAAFGATGEVCTSFLRETRELEAAKATLLTQRHIDQDTYWAIVDLSAFAEFHADESFAALRTAYQKAKQVTSLEDT